MTVEEYLREDGSCPFRGWFDDLNVLAAAKVATAIVRMELGQSVERVMDRRRARRVSDRLGGGIQALPHAGGGSVDQGGTKKRQQADIRQAGALLDEYTGRKAKLKKARS